MRYDLTKMQVQAVAINLREALSDDERAYLDTLEGETDLYELVARLLDQVETDEGIQARLAEQIADRTARKQRAAERVRHTREAIQALMECAQIDKLALPEATLSVRKVAPKAIVTDEAAVPDELCKFKRSPDMAAIKAEMEAGRAVSGVPLDNGSISLTVRRK